MTRTEILTRYRRLRQISKEHHRDVLDIIAPDVVLDWAKRIGLMQGKTLILESEHEMTLAEDLATYLPRLGRPYPLDRYALTAPLLPAPTRQSYSRRCDMPDFPSGVSSGGTQPRA
jgi:hypothetical protein